MPYPDNYSSANAPDRAQTATEIAEQGAADWADFCDAMARKITREMAEAAKAYGIPYTRRHSETANRYNEDCEDFFIDCLRETIDEAFGVHS